MTAVLHNRPSADVLDPPIRELVWALNRIPGVSTMSSCGGHDKPTISSQTPAGSWYVNLYLARNKNGWDALTKLAATAFETETDFMPWSEGVGDLRFELRGTGSPQAFIDLL